MFKNINGYSEDRFFNIETFTEDKKMGLCSDGIGGKVYKETKEKCMLWKENKKQYKNTIDNEEYIIPDKVKEEIIWKEGNDTNKFYSNKITNPCQKWLDDPEKKDPSKECLQAMWDNTGCKYNEAKKTKFTKTHNFKTLY